MFVLVEMCEQKVWRMQLKSISLKKGVDLFIGVLLEYIVCCLFGEPDIN